MSERDSAGRPEASIDGHVTLIQQDLQVPDAVGRQQELTQLVATISEALRIRVRERGSVGPQRGEVHGAPGGVVLVKKVGSPEVAVNGRALLLRLLSSHHMPHLLAELSTAHSLI